MQIPLICLKIREQIRLPLLLVELILSAEKLIFFVLDPIGFLHLLDQYQKYIAFTTKSPAKISHVNIGQKIEQAGFELQILFYRCS